MNDAPPPFSIGDIVALKSNPFFAGLNDIIMSGESDSVSPLMIVIETIIESQNKHNEKTGAIESVKGRKNCKCLWYSHKTWQFEEAWLPVSFLKTITPYSSITPVESTLSAGTLVTLSTLKLERKKRKSFLKHDGHNFEDKNGQNTIHHVVSFICPVMHVMDTRKNDDNEQSFDLKEGYPRKSFPNKLVKCKWFNHGTEKMSERLLPIEALSIIKQPDESLMQKINETIKGDSFITISNPTPTLIKPLSITYNSGEYLLRGYDYILNRVIECEFPSENYKEFAGKQAILDSGPAFGFIEAPIEKLTTVIQEIVDFVKKANLAQSYLRIKYTGKGKSTWKTLSNYTVKILPNSDVKYISGYCDAKKEDRTFRLDKIQKLQQLGIKYKLPSLTAIKPKIVRKKAIPNQSPPPTS